jgi:hypothetical protein
MSRDMTPVPHQWRYRRFSETISTPDGTALQCGIRELCEVCGESRSKAGRFCPGPPRYAPLVFGEEPKKV